MYDENMIDFKALEKDAERTVTQPFLVLRFDGVRFGTYTKDFNFPEDDSFRDAMDSAAEQALTEFSGLLAYSTSDEISVVLYRADDFQQFYGGGRLMKLTSIGAGLLSSSISQSFPNKTGYFDGRGFGLDTFEEVVTYLESRRRSSVKNAVGMAASTLFTHKQLMGLDTSVRAQMLADAGSPVESMVSPGFLNGRLLYKAMEERVSTFVDKRTGQERTVAAKRTIIRTVTCTPENLRGLELTGNRVN